MPTRRIRRGPRRVRPRRRMMRRVWRRYRRPQTRIHSFKRTCILDPLTLVNSPLTGAITFKMSDLDNYQEFSDLFDSYRLIAVKLSFVPNSSSAPVADSIGTVGVHSLHTAIDHNDSGTPSDALELMQYDTYKRTNVIRGQKRYFHINTLNTGTGGDELNWKKWISTANTDITYYGLKYVIDPLDSALRDIIIDVFATYYFQCKSVI